jgi:hypothetical protein
VAVFRIARNPDPDSTLPFVLSVPLPAGPRVLKAKDTWPRTTKVYCHRADWPDEPEVVEETAVRACVRRGWPSTSCSTGPTRTARSSSSPR